MDDIKERDRFVRTSPGECEVQGVRKATFSWEVEGYNGIVKKIRSGVIEDTNGFYHLINNVKKID